MILVGDVFGVETLMNFGDDGVMNLNDVELMQSVVMVVYLVT